MQSKAKRRATDAAAMYMAVQMHARHTVKLRGVVPGLRVLYEGTLKNSGSLTYSSSKLGQLQDSMQTGVYARLTG